VEEDLDFNTFFQKKTNENVNQVKSTIPQKIETIKEEIQDDIIKSPQLILTCINSKNEKESIKIILTPNSINGIVKKGDKFTFGRISDDNKNDYSFPEDTIGNKQFVINYNNCIKF
jgi:hypothetical protein